jgi:hypothetical protein
MIPLSKARVFAAGSMLGKESTALGKWSWILEDSDGSAIAKDHRVGGGRNEMTCMQWCCCSRAMNGRHSRRQNSEISSDHCDGLSLGQEAHFLFFRCHLLISNRIKDKESKALKPVAHLGLVVHSNRRQSPDLIAMSSGSRAALPAKRTLHAGGHD